MVCTGPFGAEHQNTLLGTPEAHHLWAFRTYFSTENGHPPSEHSLKNRNSSLLSNSFIRSKWPKMTLLVPQVWCITILSLLFEDWFSLTDLQSALLIRWLELCEFPCHHDNSRNETEDPKHDCIGHSLLLPFHLKQYTEFVFKSSTCTVHQKIRL